MAAIHIKAFDELNNKTLYQILKLRFDVFVLEQSCFYDEFDDVDFKALHFYIQEENTVIGYLRLYEKNANTCAFGRMVVNKQHRKLGVAKRLIDASIDYAKKHWSHKTMVINAQTYLLDYYGSFGFNVISEPYDDAGIMHADMKLDLKG